MNINAVPIVLGMGMIPPSYITMQCDRTSFFAMLTAYFANGVVAHGSLYYPSVQVRTYYLVVMTATVQHSNNKYNARGGYKLGLHDMQDAAVLRQFHIAS